MLRRLLAIVLLTCAVASAPRAQSVLVLDAQTADRTDLRTHIGVLRDPGGQFDIRAVRALHGSLTVPEPGVGLNLSYSRDVVWLRLLLRSTLPQTSQWRLELDYAALDHADLYDGDAAVQRAGDRIAFDARALPHRNPLFAITLAPGETRELWLRAQSQGSLTLNPLLWRARAFRLHSENTYALHALYFGMLLALAGYNLLLFLALRDRAFLHYVVFVLAMGIGIASIYGLAGQYLWPNAVDWSNRALIVAFALSGVAGPLFTQAFLATAQHAPGWHRWLTAAAWINIGLVAMGFFADLYIAMQITSVTILIICVFTLACGITCLARGVPGAKLFVLAWTALMLGGVLMALRNFGLMPTNFVTLHGMQVGSVIEMLLLSFALANRFNLIKQEKAQAQAQALAAQRQLVASLQQHERELELRVTERTEELAAANEQLRELALRDPLTALANRAALYTHLNQALRRARENHRPVCLMLMDLDGFKNINDRMGHEMGDRVLVEVADRLHAAVRRGDLVARLGGDEFVIVAEDLALPQGADQLAQAVLRALSQPYAAHPSARIGASIGMASGGPGAEDGDELLRRADAAMYAAKTAGRGTARWAETSPAGERTTRA
jgi:diguanylate cyclase (GGDEF)-like protein